MNRTEKAEAIAEDLLNNDTLDENNFSYDTDALLDYVQKTVLEHFKDYVIISGSVL